MRTAYEILNDKLTAHNLLQGVEVLDFDNLAFEIRKDIIIFTTAYRFERLKELDIERGALVNE